MIRWLKKYIRKGNFQIKGEKKNWNKNMEREKVNCVSFCVRIASSGKLVISLIYT